MNYLLKDKKVIKVTDNFDMFKYWTSQHLRNIGCDKFKGIDVTISTAFNGHNPLFFETWIFGKGLNQIIDKYPDYTNATTGHKTVFNYILKILTKNREIIQSDILDYKERNI